MGVGQGSQQGSGSALLRAWQGRGLLAISLFPISLVYGALVALRRFAFQCGILKVRRVGCPVLVVGNVVAGGAGKTPTTVGIVRHLLARGIKVGVVSRGYGRKTDDVRRVRATDDVADVGDEPKLIARTTGAPVYVGRNRHAAATALLADCPDTHMVVCDDGLQHYALYRDMEICVFDDRAVGNGWLLPAGPLRERWPRKALRRAGQDDDRLLVLRTSATDQVSGFSASRSLADHAIRSNGDPIDLHSLEHPILALAGIARPQAFFSALADAGIAVDKTLPLADHFDFRSLDTTQLQGYQVLCSEKDAEKLWTIWPQALAVPLVQTLEPAFLVALDRLVDDALRTKLSSTHGHQTA